MGPPVRPRPRAGRRRRWRRVAWLRVGALALVAGLLAALVVALLTSPRLGVTRVAVVGARSVPNSLIVWQASIPDGANLFRLRTERVARRVAALPAIRSASVRRCPPHTVVIKVVEREPVMFVRSARGPLYLDRDGVCFQRSGDETPAVEVVGIPSHRFVPGRRLADRCVSVAVQTCIVARAEGLAPRRMVVGPAGEINLLLAGGATLKLGEPERLTEKLHKARLALEALKGRGPIEYVDVSCPDAVVWKPVQPPSAAAAQARARAARDVP